MKSKLLLFASSWMICFFSYAYSSDAALEIMYHGLRATILNHYTNYEAKLNELLDDKLATGEINSAQFDVALESSLGLMKIQLYQQLVDGLSCVSEVGGGHVESSEEFANCERQKASDFFVLRKYLEINIDSFTHETALQFAECARKHTQYQIMAKFRPYDFLMTEGVRAYNSRQMLSCLVR